VRGTAVQSPPAHVGLDTPVACPACNADRLEIFHEQHGVPVHSCRLVDTVEEAEAFPRGSLRLGLCRVCGFITNTAYDPSLQSYFVSYEETQGFSPRFRDFMYELAERWIDRYELQGKHVLEIGCGKGEFLVAMCERGAGGATGIDPAIVVERVSSGAASRITFIRDLYDDRYAHLEADAVVCRHTLEHIGPVAEFLRIIRRSLDRSQDTVVLFELPDVLRVLRECAFWDIYYEHCSYFTPGSLARLFRAVGFEVLDLELDYENQYILLEAKAGNSVVEPLPLEERPEQVAEAVTTFSNELAAVKERWHGELRELHERGGRAVLWGSGSKGVSFLTTLGIHDQVSHVVDINPYKHGKFMAGTGHEIIPPEALPELQPDLVIAMNPVYLEEIQRDLDRLGVDARLEAV
jgi:SAM-dependent methyltransferase